MTKNRFFQEFFLITSEDKYSYTNLKNLLDFNTKYLGFGISKRSTSLLEIHKLNYVDSKVYILNLFKLVFILRVNTNTKVSQKDLYNKHWFRRSN